MSSAMQAPGNIDRVRVDVWLDVACLFKTRSAAQQACKNGKVSVNDSAAKPHREVRAGDEIVISRPLGRKQRVVVKGIADRNLPKDEARLLYEDLTPPPTPEEVEMRRFARMNAAAARAAGTPDKRQRRMIRRLKGLE